MFTWILFMKLKYVKHILFEKRQQNDAAYTVMMKNNTYFFLQKSTIRKKKKELKIIIKYILMVGIRHFLIREKIRKINLHF